MEAALRAILCTDPTWDLTCQDLMLAVCLKGRLDVIRRLQEVLHQTPITLIVNAVKAQSQTQVRRIFSAVMPRMTAGERCALVDMLCRDDEFRLILLLDESYEITTADVEHRQACALLDNACWNGNLDLAVWLANRFEFQTEDVVTRVDDVCARGHIHVMKWLTDRFRLTAAHARKRNILLYTCWSGDLDFVQWVVGRFGLTARDARKNHHCLLWRLCTSGRAQVTAWVVEHFGLGLPGSRLSLAVMPRAIGPYIPNDEQSMRAIRWIEKAQAIRLGPRKCRRLLYHAIGYQHLTVMRWVVHRHDLMQKDLALPAWLDRRWLDVMWHKVWTEAGEVGAVQWPEEGEDAAPQWP